MASTRVDLKKVNKDRISNKKLIIIDNGNDVLFNINIEGWKGCKTSEMTLDHEGKKLLKWVLKGDFDIDAQMIIEDQLKVDL